MEVRIDVECEDSDIQGTDVDSPNYLSMTRMIKSAIPSRSSKDKPTAPYEPYDPMKLEDESWQLVVHTKPADKKSVLYIGNLSPSTNEEKLRKFIEKRSESLSIPTPRIFNCRVFSGQEHEEPKENQPTVVGAGVTIPASAQPILMNRTFWPRPAYAGPWVFKDQKSSGAVHTVTEHCASTAVT